MRNNDKAVRFVFEKEVGSFESVDKLQRAVAQ